ncbi:uncharacterized protein H6S33_004806 [Morchella sextelata]|uniref:uncharacterized protein n=1 Tax=Morchella sextelata TaxID=1174677 RepID=UPI001D043103|nr:uncharacterized protein H6S33_004806 [Morchella sextelata]KAH0605584.1 hypothetical protein H6S33_004806 [Morchella sextelata]
MTSLTPPPLPPHTVKFIESATSRTLLEIFSGFSVNLERIFSNSPPNIAELERRLKLLLSDSQRLSTVLPKSETKYESLLPWTGRSGPAHRRSPPGSGPMCEAFSKNFNIGQMEMMSGRTGRVSKMHDYKFYHDACQMLNGMADCFDNSQYKITLQDPRMDSGIALRIVDARCTALDPKLPILFVLFAHETTEHAGPNSPSLKWMQHALKIDGAISQMREGTVANSHLLLRQLVYNSHRLPPGCEEMFDRARDKVYEKDFVASFILPMDPLSHKALERLSRSQKCARVSCAKPAFLLCGGCGIVYYCSQGCQKSHRDTHKELCTRIATSPPPRSINFIVFPLIDSKSGTETRSIVNEYLSQRDLVRIEEGNGEAAHLMLNPFPDRGFLTSVARRGPKERFIVRMQESMGGAVLLVYDAEMTFKVHVRVVPELCELVASNKKWKGQRCYLYARHLDGDKGRKYLEVLLDVMPDQGLLW